MKKIALWSFLNISPATILFAASGNPTNPASQMQLPGFAINFGSGVNLVDTIELMLFFTILTLAPAILILCTCFTRIVVVLSFLRQAIGVQNLPPNQLLIGLALFLSIFVMAPTGNDIYQKALLPFMNNQQSTTESLKTAEISLREFMFKYTREQDIQLFYDITGTSYPQTKEDVPTLTVVPAFIISELKTSFQMGLLLYIPFLILDMIIASVLMAMGMMMLPPVVISMPFKLLLFILVDGWQLVTGSILRSFGP